MSDTLSSTQLAALLDILTHYDTYSEIRDFRKPGSLTRYGPPFTAEAQSSTSPALQTLVSRFVLSIPGLRDVPKEFWTVQVHELIEALENANLSESYDKGSVGSRKTLSTAVSALIEYPVRGTFGGFAKVSNPNPKYDLTKADDLSRSFRDFMDESIYGNILDDLVQKTSETDRLEEQGDLVKAVHEFVLVNLASFMHYTLILSPKGQYLLKLIDNANKLVPYMLIRQTLRIGNVASMLSAMMKLGLAKMSVASLTNWMGITQTQDEGMNLMQQIISTVLNWDIKDLESRSSKIEKDKKPPTKEQMKCLREYTTKTHEEQEKLRKQSAKSSKSIVVSILESANLSSDLSESSHKLALEYLSVQLSVRDRKEIIRILCHSSPDHLTNLVRSVMQAYEPVIRQMHNAVDLSDTVGDLQAFLTDMLKLSRIQPPGKDGKTVVPTVGDFVQLLKNHQYSVHKCIHQCCKNGKELTGWYLEWAKHCASQFKRDTSTIAEDSSKSFNDAGKLNDSLASLYSQLDETTRQKITPILDAQTKYLKEMHETSRTRLAEVLRSPPSKNPAIAKILSAHPSSRPSSRPGSRASSPAPGMKRTPTSHDTSSTGDVSEPTPTPTVNASSAPAGPGAYLSRWQDLLDCTPVTSLTLHGAVKKASDQEVVQKSAVDVDGEKMVDFKGKTASAVNAAQSGTKPDVTVVVKAMGEQFRKLLAEKGKDW